MAIHFTDAAVEIHRFVVGPIDNNVFVVRCRQSGEALLIDAANEHELLLATCKELGVRRVVETHGHDDHIQAVPQLRDAGYSVAVAAEDAAMLPSYDLLLLDDEPIEVGNLRLRTIHTPGHTPGSTCFSLEGFPILFSGDTLFPGGPGNTASPIGDFATILNSIDRRLFAAFPPDHRPSRPRRRHHHRRRVAATRCLGRTWLVTRLGRLGWAG